MSDYDPPTHDGPHVESLDGDGEPLGYCAGCFALLPVTVCGTFGCHRLATHTARRPHEDVVGRYCAEHGGAA